jgi:hypothetical protein
MPRSRNSAALRWLVTVCAGAEVVSAYRCPDVRHAVLLAGVVRRFWPGLRVAVRRYPQPLTVVRHGRVCACHRVSGGRVA